MSFWVWYDFMGRWVLLNVVTIFPYGLFFFILDQSLKRKDYTLFVVVLFALFAYFFLIQSFTSVWVSMVLTPEPDIRRQFTTLIHTTFVRVIPVIGGFFILFGLLFMFMRYYLGSILATQGILPILILGIVLWFIIFTIQTMLWSIPAMAFKPMPWYKYFTWGFMILLANPSFSFKVFFCYTLLCFLNMVPVFFFFVGMVFPAIFLTCAYEILSRKYDAIQTQRDLSNESQIYRDFEDEFLNRSWEHIIKPWKM